MKLIIQSMTLVAGLSILGCSSSVRNGIVYSQSGDSLVRNGTAYDTAMLPVGEHDTVVIPTRAKVLDAANGDTIRIELQKTLGFIGHPSERHTIDEVRKIMGCAWRSDGRKLRLATFGEFDSGGDGGQRIELTVTVPDGIQVERGDIYEMPRSGITGARSSKLKRRDGGMWYAPLESKEKWMPVLDEPNPALAAQR